VAKENSVARNGLNVYSRIPFDTFFQYCTVSSGIVDEKQIRRLTRQTIFQIIYDISSTGNTNKEAELAGALSNYKVQIKLEMRILVKTLTSTVYPVILAVAPSEEKGQDYPSLIFLKKPLTTDLSRFCPSTPT